MGQEEKQDSLRDLWREAIRAITLGWDLALPIFIGVLVGYFLDRWLGTTYIFTIGLLVAGIALGYYNVGRFIQRMDKMAEEENKGKEEMPVEDEHPRE